MAYDFVSSHMFVVFGAVVDCQVVVMSFFVSTTSFVSVVE